MAWSIVKPYKARGCLGKVLVHTQHFGILVVDRTARSGVLPDIAVTSRAGCRLEWTDDRTQRGRFSKHRVAVSGARYKTDQRLILYLPESFVREIKERLILHHWTAHRAAESIQPERQRPGVLSNGERASKKLLRRYSNKEA